MLLLLIPAFPLAAFTLNLLIGRRLGPASAWVSVGAAAASAAASVRVFLAVMGGATPAVDWRWLPLAGEAFRVGFVADPMGALMLLVVTGIGTLITLYSIGYMAGDPRYSRFFAYLSLFTTAMLLLVLADHFLLLFIGWELVGLCSYLLISFWFEKPAAADAGKKAFITTRIGDTGFLIGLFLLFATTGTLRLSDLPAIAHDPSPWIGVAALLLFCGAAGKSAQFPLHVWLPDAMEGPTPVSALIHAATMVAAGVYLVARTFVLFEAHPWALLVVAVIGALTAFFAATIAVTQTDIKRVLAYSTISQLGLMMLGLGCGSQTAGLFHLVAHAWFKALLFLGAGSVIHALHHQDITRMGGLLRSMPVTAGTFIVGAISMAGIWPFSGFWSKEEILVAAQSHGTALLWFGLGIAWLTAFYISRVVFLTFCGKPRESAHPHESPFVMTGPLIVLAIGAAGIGLIGSPWSGNWLQHFLGVEALGAHSGSKELPQTAGLIALSAILAAAWRYGLNRPLVPAPLKVVITPLYQLAAHKYYVDELYDRWIIRPVLALTQRAFRFDLGVIDELVNRAGLGTLALSRMKQWVDTVLVDGAVNGTAAVVGAVGAAARRLQAGLVQQYLLFAALGAAALLAWRLNLVR